MHVTFVPIDIESLRADPNMRSVVQTRKQPGMHGYFLLALPHLCTTAHGMPKHHLFAVPSVKRSKVVRVTLDLLRSRADKQR